MITRDGVTYIQGVSVKELLCSPCGFHVKAVDVDGSNTSGTYIGEHVCMSLEIGLVIIGPSEVLSQGW